jgi:hypothetical protein
MSRSSSASWLARERSLKGVEENSLGPKRRLPESSKPFLGASFLSLTK